MTFQWPELLWLMLAVPALVAAYVLLLRKRRKLALQYASLSLVREANKIQSIRRHVPPLLLLLALHVCGVTTFARRLEFAGSSLWRYLAPYSRRVLPADTVAKAAGLGALWGWLPCAA